LLLLLRWLLLLLLLLLRWLLLLELLLALTLPLLSQRFCFLHSLGFVCSPFSGLLGCLRVLAQLHFELPSAQLRRQSGPPTRAGVQAAPPAR
jgi:hypothetical protein